MTARLPICVLNIMISFHCLQFNDQQQLCSLIHCWNRKLKQTTSTESLTELYWWLTVRCCQPSRSSSLYARQQSVIMVDSLLTWHSMMSSRVSPSCLFGRIKPKTCRLFHDKSHQQPTVPRQYLQCYIIWCYNKIIMSLTVHSTIHSGRNLEKKQL